MSENSPVVVTPTATQAVAVALTMQRRTIPPTIGPTRPDPAVDLDLAVTPRSWTPGPVLSNSFGFGGHNGSIVFAPLVD